jgi:hypothetical protein
LKEARFLLSGLKKTGYGARALPCFWSKDKVQWSLNLQEISIAAVFLKTAARTG